MKLKLFLIITLFLSVSAFSQSRNNISVYWSTVTNDMDIHGAVGDFGYAGNGGAKLGINYERRLSQHFSIQAGLQYSDDKLTLNSFLPPKSFNTPQEIKLITVPILAKVNFWNVVFIDGGILADFETSNTSTHNQSGIGYEIGGGLQYHFANVLLFVNPYAQYHHAIGFGQSSPNFNLIEAGWKFGLGYSF